MSVSGRSCRQQGAVAVEFALLVPMLLLLTGLLVGAARTWSARAAVEQAAGAAARGASQARDPDQAQRAASRLALAQLAVAGLRCHRVALLVDAAALGLPAGRPGEVSTTVSCEVPLSDLVVPGWPGSLPVQVSAAATVDRYRERR